ncbi:hypothetical protein Nepgr_032997 [Nepenthes gracilis]|uniref:CCHC-type domain-containing protein n=1 Tax=Nepenthes gracilis TaxID=150966 RepID=A0AAD3Y8C0_NEPGR|nr:hypothetical protein Nepgr_032997 [Nepenthes gracilis]
MSSICSSLRIWMQPWNHRNSAFSDFRHSNRKLNFVHRCVSSLLKDDSSPAPKRNQLDYDPSHELFGLEVDLEPRDAISAAREPRSWFGPNGQYIRELPCPSCRGRGYTPCTECGIDRSRIDCSKCNGKGVMTCDQCSGDCVIWEESIDERPWEKARSSSPVKVKEEDEVDSLDLKLDVRKKSRRVYQSPSPEVGLKISRSLKSLNAKTGLFSRRMKIIHRDPVLHAQRVAAIKKVKGTAAARKHASETMKAFFSDPENRHKRSIAMKGAKYYCQNCGREGHRRSYCPEMKNADRRFRCGLCGKRGHNRRTCYKSRAINSRRKIEGNYHCKVCGQFGHNRRTCSQRTDLPLNSADMKIQRSIDSRGESRKPYQCRICSQIGHNSRTCPRGSRVLSNTEGMKTGSLQDSGGKVRRRDRCRICGQSGHNHSTCPRGWKSS